MSHSYDIKKIIWTCRRGMLELDVILIPFAKQYFEQLSEQQQAVFVRLLDEADPDLFNWLMGHGKPDDSELAEMVVTVRDRTNVSIKGS